MFLLQLSMCVSLPLCLAEQGMSRFSSSVFEFIHTTSFTVFLETMYCESLALLLFQL